DQGLAYLAIAATAIPHSGRGQWLQHVARKLDKRPGARYTAAWRARAKAGRIQLKLECDEAGLVVGLIDAGLIGARMATPFDELDMGLGDRLRDLERQVALLKREVSSSRRSRAYRSQSRPGPSCGGRA